jgi:amino acid transporter
VNYLAELIPSDVREQFLSKLGFEKKPVVRTPKLALWFLTVMMILGYIVGVLINFPNFLMMVGVAFLGGLFIWQIFRYYKEEEIPKWRKKKAT